MDNNLHLSITLALYPYIETATYVLPISVTLNACLRYTPISVSNKRKYNK